MVDLTLNIISTIVFAILGGLGPTVKFLFITNKVGINVFGVIWKK